MDKIKARVLFVIGGGVIYTYEVIASSDVPNLGIKNGVASVFFQAENAPKPNEQTISDLNGDCRTAMGKMIASLESLVGIPATQVEYIKAF